MCIPRIYCHTVGQLLCRRCTPVLVYGFGRARLWVLVYSSESWGLGQNVEKSTYRLLGVNPYRARGSRRLYVRV